MTAGRWKIRLGAAAENDFVNILRTTLDRFGPTQVEIYRSILVDALEQLSDGPELPGSAARDDILPGLRSLHVARRGRRGRHFIIYRAADETTIEIIRILHDRMDLAAHIPV